MNLRAKLIRVAHENPALRPHLLPILKDSAREASEPKEAARGWVIPRNSYIPQDNPTVRRVESPEGMEIWAWEATGRTEQIIPYAIVFSGKSQKPVWYHAFRSDASRDKAISEAITNYSAVAAMKTQRMNERKNFQHELKVGDVLYTSWGYDQTQVEFFEVTALPTPKTVLVREIAGRTVSQGMDSNKVEAVPGKFIGPALKRIPGKYGVKIDESRTAYLWDGKPKYVTSGGGH